MAAPRSHCSFTASEPMLNRVFEAAFGLVMTLDIGKGNLKEAVEALRVKDVGELEGLGVLHIAACRGSLEVCRYLIEELRVDVNVVDKEGRTPLKFAILCRNSVAKYLLDHGADPNRASHDRIYPLHEAALKGDCLTVELLLAKGAYIDLVAIRGTPLHCAASGDHDSTMKILLDHNADYNKMVDGRTPLIAAVDANSRKCTLLLYRAGAEFKGALTYSAKKLHSEKVVSSDFLDCIMEDAGADCIVSDDEPVVKRKIRAAGYKRMGSYAFKRKNYSDASGCYSMAIAFDPDATVLSNRSLCWLLMGDGGKALLDANECRKMRPDWPKACYRQGAALMLLKDYVGASERFLDGLKLEPGNSEIEDALRKAWEAMKISQNSKAD
ncbi:tankyrase-1-like isoform X2 [Brachypodium distachyon]|uniref:tankyrase-1-like isoform X2 n=1 Tax=Brachypodium distachyon TaxID=15368 RepID=UPI000D0D6086|nr:tankyrase-1-like isoform X2 [Brachypodium distachyon]|eukprot:XP_024315535.1 tankyrase-1-like isoform X2 [Brachypodium distachyon]